MLAAARYVMCSFQDLKHLGDGLRLLVSPDGLRWSELPGAPLLLPLTHIEGAKVFRDPSMVWHHGHFHLVFTSDLCVDQVPDRWKCRRHTKPRPMARFGYARSRDLVSWEAIRLVDVPLKDACSLWAPEVCALPQAEGGGLMVMFTATIAAGICPVTMRESVHRPYYMVARDVQQLKWSAPKPLRISSTDGRTDESVIDLFPLIMPLDQPMAEAPPLVPQAVGKQVLGGSSGGAPGVSKMGDAHVEAQVGTGHVLLYKAEANRCGKGFEAPLEWTLGQELRDTPCSLVLRQARASKAAGPWLDDARATGAFFPHAISRPCVEGPTVIRAPEVVGGWYVLFDAYRTDCTLYTPAGKHGCDEVGGQPAASSGLRLASTDEDLKSGRALDRQSRGQQQNQRRCAYQTAQRGFGALHSADLTSWRDITGLVSTPADYKHGTALMLPDVVWQSICETATKSSQAAFRRPCLQRARSLRHHQDQR